ncbi:hypothetical protein GCM10022382_06680 [Microbacterium invictum]
MRAEQIDASDDPAHQDRDAHHDEPGERIQHASSLWRLEGVSVRVPAANAIRPYLPPFCLRGRAAVLRFGNDFARTDIGSAL